MAGVRRCVHCLCVEAVERCHKPMECWSGLQLVMQVTICPAAQLLRLGVWRQLVGTAAAAPVLLRGRWPPAALSHPCYMCAECKSCAERVDRILTGCLCILMASLPHWRLALLVPLLPVILDVHS